MTEERLQIIETIVAARLGLMTVDSRDLLAALHQARAAAIELGEALLLMERYETLEPVQARCPWLVLFGEEEG